MTGKRNISSKEKLSPAAREVKRREWIQSIHRLPSQSGLALRAWRAAHNVTQAALAGAWGVGQRSIIRLEQRDALPVLVKLAIREQI